MLSMWTDMIIKRRYYAKYFWSFLYVHQSSFVRNHRIPLESIKYQFHENHFSFFHNTSLKWNGISRIQKLYTKRIIETRRKHWCFKNSIKIRLFCFTHIVDIQGIKYPYFDHKGTWSTLFLPDIHCLQSWNIFCENVENNRKYSCIIEFFYGVFLFFSLCSLKTMTMTMYWYQFWEPFMRNKRSNITVQCLRFLIFST